MDFWSKGTLKPLLVPGGALFLAAVALLQSGIVPLSAPAIHFYYYAVFAAGILLAWRFHSSRVLSALILLLVAGPALEFFASGHVLSTVSFHTAFEVVTLLLPLNFLALSLIRERGLTASGMAARLGVLFLESVFVAVLCRPGADAVPGFLHPALLDQRLFSWTRIPQLSLLAFAGVLGALLFRFLLYRKPVESGMFWSLAAVCLGLQAGGVGAKASAYIATGGLILAGSIIENSYLLAYHDELTALPARRAFNDALLQLKETYSIAVVDIDHFKRFNDTYGHDTGDHVLRMVATRLGRVSGGGHAFRVGGEEFCILFPGESVKDALPHLEVLRAEVEAASFRVRSHEERRRAPQARADRRQALRRKTNRAYRDAISSLQDLAVTISIGVAEPATREPEVEKVLQAADGALYRAKRAGRNRVEAAGTRGKLKRSIA